MLGAASLLRNWTEKIRCATYRQKFISIICLFLLTFLFTYYTVNRSSFLIAETSNPNSHGIYGGAQEVPENDRIYSPRGNAVSETLFGQEERNRVMAEPAEDQVPQAEDAITGTLSNDHSDTSEESAELLEHRSSFPKQDELSQWEDERLPEDNKAFPKAKDDNMVENDIVLDRAMALSMSANTIFDRRVVTASPETFHTEYSDPDIDHDANSITGSINQNHSDEPIYDDELDVDDHEYSDEFYTSYELDEENYDMAFDDEIKAAYPQVVRKIVSVTDHNGVEKNEERSPEIGNRIRHIRMNVDSYNVISNDSNAKPPASDMKHEEEDEQVRKGGIAKVPTSHTALANTDMPNSSIIFYKPEQVDIMSFKPLQFLDNYKNPCWVERVSSWYMENTYLKVRNVLSVLTNMSAVLRSRQASGDYHRVRCLPFFFMIGQPKCGSSDLYEKLMAHPDAVRPPIKEPHWWARARLGRHRAYGHLVPIHHYTDLFDYAAYIIENHQTVLKESGRMYHNMITGEGSMSTFWDNDHWWNLVGNENSSEPKLLNPDYIHHLLPQSKLILILRNPSTRMYSDYLYFRKSSKSRADFHNVVVNAVDVYRNCTKDNSLRSCLYNRTIADLAKIRLRVGIYAPYLQDWFRVFPRHQFFIVKTEDYAVYPRTILRQIYDFHGLRQLSVDRENMILSMAKVNTRTQADKDLGDMFPETRTLLDEFYKPYNVQLSRLLRDTRFMWQDEKRRKITTVRVEIVNAP